MDNKDQKPATYKFDFSNLTALDAAKVASSDNWRICEVINSCVDGGLANYKPDELPEIAKQFAQRYSDVYMSPIARIINGLGTKK